MSDIRRQAIAEVDAQILRHRNEIRALESKRNALMPISQLPAEILCRIFHFVQSEAGDETPTEDTATKRVGSKIDWIRISHVTRHWRDVAINQTTLWTCPPTQNTEWALKMLERSKMAPLRIMLDASVVKAGSEVLDTILVNMSRVATINVWKASSTFLRRFFGDLPAKMPLLKEITINVHLMAQGGQESAPVLWQENEQLLTLPDSIHRRAPDLRSLRLAKIGINWDSPMLRSLTTLDLYFSSPPTLAQLRSTLENMPNLEDLTLQNSLPKPSRMKTPPQKPIVLSKLKKLIVGGDPNELECFFTQFLTPCVKHVHCSFLYQEGSYDLPFILSTIKHPHSRPLPGPRSLLFFFHGLFIAQIAFGDDEIKQPSLNLKVIAMENLTRPPSADDTDLLVSQLFNGVDWSRLHYINMSRMFVSSDVLAETFGTLPNLEKISVGGPSAPSLIDALQLGADDDPDSDPTPIAFPGLREVSMREVDFELGYESDLDVDDLLDCLKSRSERGVPINKLTLRECPNVDADTVELLEEVVEVDWDHDGEVVHITGHDDNSD